MLFPQLREIRHDFRRNFEGMTAEPVPLDALLAVRERLLRELQDGLDENERRFLLSLVSGGPDWSLMGIAQLEQLPGIRWKLHNLERLRESNPMKFAEQADLLAALLAATASGAVAPPASGVE